MITTRERILDIRAQIIELAEDTTNLDGPPTQLSNALFAAYDELGKVL